MTNPYHPPSPSTNQPAKTDGRSPSTRWRGWFVAVWVMNLILIMVPLGFTWFYPLLQAAWTPRPTDELGGDPILYQHFIWVDWFDLFFFLILPCNLILLWVYWYWPR